MNDAQEIQVISERIAKTEMARALIEVGKYDKALEMLTKMKDSYQEESKKQLVQHMIDETLKKKNGRSILTKITDRLTKNK